MLSLVFARVTLALVPALWQVSFGASVRNDAWERLDLEFVRVSPATFQMGSPEDEPGRDPDERLHAVTLTISYELLAREVTQRQFTQLLGYNPSAFAACGGECPVENVSWHEACAFANAVSTTARRDTCYICRGGGPAIVCALDPRFARPQDCPGYRLPTEAEWEFAARAGSATAFPGGPLTLLDCQPEPNLTDGGWYCGNAGRTTHPVGVKEPNALGLYDLAGNVFEWTGDWYGDYPPAPAIDPVGPATGERRVGRGGSWRNPAQWCRAAFRGDEQPARRGDTLGFRLARSVR